MRVTRGSKAIHSPCNDTALRTFFTKPKPGILEEAQRITCPLCHSHAANAEWHITDAVFVRCKNCGLWRQNPQPLPSHIAARYDETYLRYETERQMDYRAISLTSLAEAGLVPKQPEGGRKAIVEVGCATGALLSAFKDAGWTALGIEISQAMADYARTRFGLNVFAGRVEEAPLEAARCDVFLATHLIEHLNDPRSFLRAAKSALRKDGSLYLITPNADGFQAMLMGKNWRSVIRDHLFLFSRRTLHALLKSEGFMVEYTGTWGGWPAGMKPACIKKIMDKNAKRFGFGDVMIVRARLAGGNDE